MISVTTTKSSHSNDVAEHSQIPEIPDNEAVSSTNSNMISSSDSTEQLSEMKEKNSKKYVSVHHESQNTIKQNL
jgi:hypothetical protein